MWLNNLDCLCFPCAAYELRHSSDLALLTKWPVFLQNAFGNPAYVNQTNLNGKLRKKTVGAKRGPSKNLGGMAHPGPPLESPLCSGYMLICRNAERVNGQRKVGKPCYSVRRRDLADTASERSCSVTVPNPRVASKYCTSVLP